MKNLTSHTDLSITDSPGAWLLGIKHSLATFSSLATQPSSLDLPSSSWGWPSNVDSSLWDSCPNIPHSDNTFDVVLIEPILHVLRCTDWPVVIKEAVRVLTLGNCLAIQVMDSIPKRAGPLLEAWAAQHLTPGLARRDMVLRPNVVLPDWLKGITALSEMVVEAMEFPIHASIASRSTSSKRQDSTSSTHSSQQELSLCNSLAASNATSGSRDGHEEIRTYASLVGKHLYKGMYEDSAPLKTLPRPHCGPHPETSPCWWWDDPAILEECRHFDSAFELVTYVCRKEEAGQILEVGRQ